MSMFPLALALILAEPAEGKDSDIFVFGIGRQSCASAFAIDKADDRSSWVMGYWTGMNVGFLRSAGRNTDIQGVMAEVKQECDRSPSMTLMQAVTNVWRKIR